MNIQSNICCICLWLLIKGWVVWRLLLFISTWYINFQSTYWNNLISTWCLFSGEGIHVKKWRLLCCSTILLFEPLLFIDHTMWIVAFYRSIIFIMLFYVWCVWASFIIEIGAWISNDIKFRMPFIQTTVKVSAWLSNYTFMWVYSGIYYTEQCYHFSKITHIKTQPLIHLFPSQN